MTGIGKEFDLFEIGDRIICKEGSVFLTYGFICFGVALSFSSYIWLEKNVRGKGGLVKIDLWK